MLDRSRHFARQPEAVPTWLDEVRVLTSRYYLASIPYFDKNMQRSAEEHVFIVQAIRFGWTEVAREAIAAHLQRCIFAFQQYLPHSQEQPAPAVPSSRGDETIPWLGRVHRLG
jgi:DNA-binding GntR family transcriptional regulator